MTKYGLVVFVCLFFIGCGGGGSANPAPSASSYKALVPSSKSSLSSASANNSFSSSIASSPSSVVERVFYIDEEGSLVVDADGDFWVTQANWEVNRDNYLSDAGAQLIPNFKDKKITYVAKQDFFGVDTFYYLENVSSQNPQKIKVVINVAPVEDNYPKWNLATNQAFTAHQKVKLPLPIDVDTGAVWQPAETAHLTFNGAEIPFQIKDSEVHFEIPDVDRAGVFSMVLKDAANESLMAASSLLVAVEKGDVTYYMGSENALGSLYVLVRTKGVSDAEFKHWLDNSVIPFLHVPIVNKYQNYWSFAVINPPAEKKINLYGGTGSADDQYYWGFIDQYIEKNRGFIVLDNDLFRASAGTKVTINLRYDANVLLHEMAHLHAKLGDEYDEDCALEYRDKTYPNVERFFTGNVAELQWGHWIDSSLAIPGYSVAPEADDQIGAFKGAFYCTDKYFRPAQATLMRHHAYPMSVVDKETWVIANYEKLGLLNSIKSKQGNGVNRIWVEQETDPQLTSFRWYLNGEALTQFDGEKAIEIDELSLAKADYTVTAKIVDLSGMVKNPHAYKTFNEYINNSGMFEYSAINPSFEKSVNFVRASGNSTKKPGVARGQLLSNSWVEHSLHIKLGTHQLLASRKYTAAEVIPPVTGASDLMAEIRVNGAVVAVQGVMLNHPSEMNYSAPLVYPQFYTLRHPALAEAYEIKIYSLPQRELVATFHIDANEVFE